MLQTIIAQLVETPEQAVNAIGQIISAFQNGYWNVGAGLIIAILAWVFTRFIMPTFAKKWIPLLTLSVAVLVGAAASLYQLPQDAVWYAYVESILLNAIVMGGTSNGLWSMVLKYILPTEPKLIKKPVKKAVKKVKKK